MIVYLIDNKTISVIQEFNNIINWGYNFVEYYNNGYRAKMYARENEYFTDQIEENLK